MKNMTEAMLRRQIMRYSNDAIRHEKNAKQEYARYKAIKATNAYLKSPRLYAEAKKAYLRSQSLYAEAIRARTICENYRQMLMIATSQEQPQI